MILLLMFSLLTTTFITTDGRQLNEACYQIVYEVGYDDIHLIEVETGHIQNLTNSPDITEIAPRWSPDGTAIAFTTVTDWFIYRLNLGEVGKTEIQEARVRELIWSPDGSMIAFTTLGDKDDRGIFVFHLDTATLEKITDNGYGLQWSPDSEALSFADQNSIYTIEINSKKLKKIFEVESEFYETWTYAWSPDWTKIIWLVAVLKNNRFTRQVYIYHVESEQHQLVAEDHWNLFTVGWSPDGSKIAFSGYLDTPEALSVIDVDTGQIAQLASVDDRTPFWPSWSFDGKKVAFIQHYIKGEGDYTELWVVDDDGSNLRYLTSITSNRGQNFAWRPQCP